VIVLSVGGAESHAPRFGHSLPKPARDAIHSRTRRLLDSGDTLRTLSPWLQAKTHAFARVLGSGDGRHLTDLKFAAAASGWITRACTLHNQALVGKWFLARLANEIQLPSSRT
jgi:hypothetical protein